MTETDPRAASGSTVAARLVVAELLARGVREVVLSPGSRSAPLAYELHAADRIGLLRLHVRVDERGAGFLALGLAKATGDAVAVVTTSGTAAANLHPSVLEASASHVPLVAVTADRPRGLVHTGANQTTDQSRLYGAAVRAAAELESGPSALGVSAQRQWQFQLARLLAAATGARTRNPGPVHLNLGLAEPLTPSSDQPDWLPEMNVDPAPGPPPPVLLPDGAATVIVAGDLPSDQGRQVAELATRARVPLLAEPSSNARGSAAALRCYRLLLDGELAEDIERVVMVGHPTLSRPVGRLLARDDVELIAVSPYADWVDPATRAVAVHWAVDLPPDDSDWLTRWQQADAALSDQVDALLEDEELFTGPALAAALWRQLGGGDTLVVGSSNPVRDLDLAPTGGDVPAVYANRGLAGIDGMLSTAVGVALGKGAVTHALVGDLTFLHDLPALVIGPAEPRPDLRIVVANDVGGSIFATLEHGEPAYLGAFERIFGTPHQIDIGSVAAAAGCAFARVCDAAELEEALAASPRGLQVIEAVIDRRRRRTLDRRLAGLAG